jgi:phosphoheptose isomerase/N-acetylglucosamine-6-phosphate deacetylase
LRPLIDEALVSAPAADAGAGPLPTPVLFHTHGIGSVDFSSMAPRDLEEVERLARARGVRILPTVFLRRSHLAGLRDVMQEHCDGRARGRYEHVLGFGMEGPLLGLLGGVPPAGCWTPTPDEWAQLAEFGELGLRYVVMAPDGARLEDEIEPGTSFRDVVDAFYTHGVKLALGHFRHDDPAESARRTERLIDYVQQRYGPSPELLITDHLFNDMPRAFTHAWRTPEQRRNRRRELDAFLAHAWTEESLERLLGPVPAVLLKAAAADRLRPTLNFDGDHVDLAICQRTVEFLGPERLIAITDDTERLEMAGESLHRREWSSLLFRDDGKVAAGSSGIAVQLRNIRSLGLTAEDAVNLVARVPQAVLEAPVGPAAGADRTALVTEDGAAELSRAYLLELADALAGVNAPALGTLVSTVVRAVQRRRTVIVAGNGGSATAAAHMASDWSRAAAHSNMSPARIVSLGDNVASTTGLANDVGFEDALAHQVRVVGGPGDLLVLLSVSGASPNLVRAASAAREAGLEVVALVGQPGPLIAHADGWASIGIGDYGLVEDLQLSVNHIVVRALSAGALPGLCSAAELPRVGVAG